MDVYAPGLEGASPTVFMVQLLTRYADAPRQV